MHGEPIVWLIVLPTWESSHFLLGSTVLKQSLGGGETGRLITKKSKKSKGGDSDEFMAYARFLQEGVCGYSPLVSW